MAISMIERPRRRRNLSDLREFIFLVFDFLSKVLSTFFLVRSAESFSTYDVVLSCFHIGVSEKPSCFSRPRANVRNRQKPASFSLQSFNNNCRHPFHHFVAEIPVLFALFS